MAAGRSLKPLVSRRRRWGDEVQDDEDEGPVLIEDSQSDGAGHSEVDDEDLDAISVGQPVHAEKPANRQPGLNGKVSRRSRRSRKKGKGTQIGHNVDEHSPFTSTADTDVMMNLARISGTPSDEAAVDYNTASQKPDPQRTDESSSVPEKAKEMVPERGGERPRKDQEDDRQRRDNDPSLAPNRGTFFMHDTRGLTHRQASTTTRGSWHNGRGRGRGVGSSTGGLLPPANPVLRAEQAAEQPWKHDLHDTINEEPGHSSSGKQKQADRIADISRPAQAPGVAVGNGQTRVVSFSTTKLLGKVQIRVNLPGTRAPVTFPDVPWKHYTRLPNHRPPLRRDKPVRISLPPNLQRYVFPTPERSFIFIPRQMRPNQQNFQRNSYQRSVAGYGYSSRRTSVYGGSIYSASVAASRRSSMAGMSRADAFSPVPFAGPMNTMNRPVVRLPYGNQPMSMVPTPSGPLAERHTPNAVHQVHTYQLPQQPTYQGIPTTTVHQPRPQKAISVTGIESPAALQHAPQGQESQPFHGQLPAHMHEQSAYGQQANAYLSPAQQYAYPSQTHVGTPLSGIPEQSLHGQSFHPHQPHPPLPYYPPYGTQSVYYYPAAGSTSYGPMPLYPTNAVNYGMGSTAPSAPQSSGHTRAASLQSSEERQRAQDDVSQAQSGMVAHESNGMVFYLPASEAQHANEGESYQPAETFVPSYAMPGLPPPTPAPESAYYYQALQMPGMQAPAFFPGPGPRSQA